MKPSPWKLDPSPRRFALVRRSFRAGGFTLIEILVVIVIIMILAGIVVGAAKYAQVKAARSRCQSEIAMMETALESYKSDNGAYPLSTATRSTPIDNCVKLYAALAGGTKQYFKFKPAQLGKDPATGNPYIIDPFGHSYNYFCQPPPTVAPNKQENPATFDLWSYGPDGVDNTADDIMNWKQ